MQLPLKARIRYGSQWSTRRWRAVLMAVTLTLLALACNKEHLHPVPDVHLSFDFNVLHYNLSNPGLSHQFSREASGGYRGIIVYRMSTSEFMAYDRACPYQPHDMESLVSISPSNSVVAECPVCNSRFVLTDGSVLDGPAAFPLKVYRTSFNHSTNRLWIGN